MPGLASAQRWVFRRYYAGRKFEHTIDAGPARGLAFFVELPEDKAIWLGNYECSFTEAVASAANGDGVCYDVGGYRGFMSGVMALAGARKVIVFEPRPSNQDAIRKLIQLNPRLTIELRTVALADRDGQARFLETPNASMGKLANSQFQPDAPRGDELIVRTARIDTLVQSGEVEPPALLKVDVEGAELDVLTGARATLARYRPKLFIEVHTRALAHSCSELLCRLGYTVRVLEADNGRLDVTTAEVAHLVALPASTSHAASVGVI